jgi:hypothetical protein
LLAALIMATLTLERPTTKPWPMIATMAPATTGMRPWYFDESNAQPHAAATPDAMASRAVSSHTQNSDVRQPGFVGLVTGVT